MLKAIVPKELVVPFHMARLKQTHLVEVCSEEVVNLLMEDLVLDLVAVMPLLQQTGYSETRNLALGLLRASVKKEIIAISLTHQ